MKKLILISIVIMFSLPSFSQCFNTELKDTTKLSFVVGGEFGSSKILSGKLAEQYELYPATLSLRGGVRLDNLEIFAFYNFSYVTDYLWLEEEYGFSEETFDLSFNTYGLESKIVSKKPVLSEVYPFLSLRGGYTKAREVPSNKELFTESKGAGSLLGIGIGANFCCQPFELFILLDYDYYIIEGENKFKDKIDFGVLSLSAGLNIQLFKIK
ncbi:hypothetical protein GW932_01405 [archaeon]|nr:hypothetical protein [archaeon]